MNTLSEDMAETARLIARERDAASKMQRVVEAAVDLVGSCEDAGLSSVTKGGVETLAATSQRPRSGDEWQYELDQGPCLDAIREGMVTYCPDLVDESHRWPQWAPKVVEELGKRSMLCLRLYTHGDSLGALNLYSSVADSFTDEEQEEASTLAAHAAVPLLAAREVDNLQLGLDRRTVIGLATGMVMERYKIDAEIAFQVLVRYSSVRNQKMYDLATHIVLTGQTDNF